MPAYGIFLDMPDIERFIAELRHHNVSVDDPVYVGSIVQEGVEISQVANAKTPIRIITILATAQIVHNDIPVVLRLQLDTMKIVMNDEALGRSKEEYEKRLNELMQELRRKGILNARRGRLDFE